MTVLSFRCMFVKALQIYKDDLKVTLTIWYFDVGSYLLSTYQVKFRTILHSSYGSILKQVLIDFTLLMIQTANGFNPYAVASGTVCLKLFSLECWICTLLSIESLLRNLPFKVMVENSTCPSP